MRLHPPSPYAPAIASKENVPMDKRSQILISGHRDPSWSTWFDGLIITHDSAGETILVGSLPDHAALYGVLEKARILNLTLCSVSEMLTAVPDASSPAVVDHTIPPVLPSSILNTEKGNSDGKE
jgi:hypothetical protein